MSQTRLRREYDFVTELFQSENSSGGDLGVVLMACYGGGLRISEAVKLKVSDIDYSRMLIRIKSGKGAKDRYSVLSQRLLETLRLYWKQQKPTDYLFPGRKAGTHMRPETLQQICNLPVRSDYTTQLGFSSDGRSLVLNPTLHLQRSLQILYAR